MSETQQTINNWISDTFGEAGSNMSVAARANEEMAELLMRLAIDDSDPEAVVEAADIVIILYRLAERFDRDLLHEVSKKMAINRQRKWNVANGHGYHVKTSPGLLSAFERIVEAKGMRPGHVAYLSRADIEAIAADALAKAGG